MTRRRVFLGRDVDVVRETREGLELNGTLRLRPGFIVDLISVRPSSVASSSRPALVTSWWIRAVGSSGPIYRGFCRWDYGGGHELPAQNSDPHQACREG